MQCRRGRSVENSFVEEIGETVIIGADSSLNGDFSSLFLNLSVVSYPIYIYKQYANRKGRAYLPDSKVFFHSLLRDYVVISTKYTIHT